MTTWVGGGSTPSSYLSIPRLADVLHPLSYGLLSELSDKCKRQQRSAGRGSELEMVGEGWGVVEV